MTLWFEWWQLVRLLRPAFSRGKSFLWFAAALAGMTIRPDLAGVTSLIRALSLSPRFYTNLLDNFHSTAINREQLAAIWCRIVLAKFPGVLTVNGRRILVGDGIKMAKEGRKMPAVKSLHQESESNSKPEYIMGHSLQALSVLTMVAGYVFAVPVVSRIHEGVVLSNRDKRTLIDKMVTMINSLTIPSGCYAVCDAYYATRKMIRGLLAGGHHLVSRVRSNAVAYLPAESSLKKRRGRPKIYGKKLHLKNFFKTATFLTALSPVYGEEGVEILYYTIDLLWRPIGRLARFVFVKHPTRGKRIFFTTDLLLSAIQIIELYGWRFKIEVSFKQAIHTVGTYAYHFWMKTMEPIKRRSGNQYLHRKTADYRQAVLRKMAAYHAYIQAGIITHGLMQYLSLAVAEKVWGSFGSWLRTIRDNVLPSEAVVSYAMHNTLAEFLAGEPDSGILTKFIKQRRVKKIKYATMRC